MIHHDELVDQADLITEPISDLAHDPCDSRSLVPCWQDDGYTSIPLALHEEIQGWLASRE